jgi:putative flippase GtrA
MLREVFLFGAIGAVGFAVDVVVLYGLNSTLGPFVARVISFLAAASTTWILNRTITFKNSESNMNRRKEFLVYISLMLVGGLVNYACYSWLIINSETAAKYLFFAVAAGSLAGMTINFTGTRLLLFRMR